MCAFLSIYLIVCVKYSVILFWIFPYFLPNLFLTNSHSPANSLHHDIYQSGRVKANCASSYKWSQSMLLMLRHGSIKLRGKCYLPFSPYMSSHTRLAFHPSYPESTASFAVPCHRQDSSSCSPGRVNSFENQRLPFPVFSVQLFLDKFLNDQKDCWCFHPLQ